ncbi:unnamed protein product [Fusarium graminearum]|nr:unnamed protein product [Fusarium graminearum]
MIGPFATVHDPAWPLSRSSVSGEIACQMHLSYCGVVKQRATGTCRHHLDATRPAPVVKSSPITFQDLLVQMERLGSVFTEPDDWVPGE